MEQTPNRGLTIYFMDGSSMKVAFPLPSEDTYRRKNMLEEVAKKQMLMIEADGGIHFIPLNNIKYMSVYPASEHPDPGVIKGARFMD